MTIDFREVNVPSRHPITISLTPEVAELVATEIASGLYASATEIIRAGLSLLAERGAYSLSDRRTTECVPQQVGLRAVRKAAKHG